jgi:hypothetical protein
MNAELISKLQKIMALTTSPVEGEAQAATAMLQRLLTQHNLDIADLEQKGAKAPTIEEQGHDLGKAAFKWKLDLAEMIASHFYCHSIVNRTAKTVVFLGRPDNVESMKMLYAWLIDQIRQISSVKRKAHQEETGEHIDPLRWQVSFGVGLVSRLGDRLAEIKTRREQDAADKAGVALVLHHQSEISDYTETKYGFRTDGRQTKAAAASAAYWAKREAEMAELKKTDPEAYYAARPWDRPEAPKTDAQKAREAKKEAKEQAKRRERWAREDARAEEKERNMSPAQRRALAQAENAKASGRSSAKEVNLEPFLGDGKHKGAKLG